MKGVKDLMEKKEKPIEKKEESIEDTKHWHHGFYSAYMLELRDDANYLDIETEHPFGEFPLRADLYILKVKEHKIDNEIAEIFRLCNVIEYKSPKDSISTEDYHQLMTYANMCGYPSKQRTGYLTEEITATLVCHSYPGKFIKRLKALGFCIEERTKGIYDVYNNNVFPTQLIVIDELEKEKYLFLSAISLDAKDENLKAFAAEGNKLKGKKDKNNFERVFNLSRQIKPDYYKESTNEGNGEDKMIPELREYFKEDLKAEYVSGEETGSLNTRKQYVRKLWKKGMSLSELAEFAETDESTIQSWLDEEDTPKSNLS
jgi:hypothetical protein